VNYGAIFDLDGVLIHSEDSQKAATLEVLAQFGIVLNDADIATKTRGRPTLIWLKELLGNRCSDEKLKTLARHRGSLVRQKFLLAPKTVQGIAWFLKSLKNAGFKIAIGTSTTVDMLAAKLDFEPAFRLIDEIVTFEEVDHAKPHPEVFLKAAKKIGLPPSACVVFEDALCGIDAALAAAMKVVLVTTSHQAHEVTHCDLAIQNFAGIDARTILRLFDN
jgi:beta-phosphoglucomutase